MVAMSPTTAADASSSRGAALGVLVLALAAFFLMKAAAPARH